jgi:hypothetical protein
MVHHRLVTRNTLIAALVACSDETVKTRARRFLMGLSCDELQFIAEFLGACILESSGDTISAADAVHAYQSRMASDDKIPILREFLGRCG